MSIYNMSGKALFQVLRIYEQTKQSFCPHKAHILAKEDRF